MGDKGGGGGMEKKLGKEKKKGKKEEMERKGKKKENQATVLTRIELEPFAQESNTLPVAYCESQASALTVLGFYCESDL